MPDAPKPLKLAVTIPWNSEFIWKRCTLSLLKLKHPADCETEFFFSEGDGWCSARRHNSCLEQGKMWKADLICILGADQTYPPDMLCKLVAHYRNGCEVVAANVPIRGHVANQGTKPFQSICWRYKPDENGNVVQTNSHKDIEFVGPAQGDLVEIHGCGSGVLMFPTEMLDYITPPWFFDEPVGPTFERKACADWPFVGRLRKDAKCKVWCDTTIQVKHIHPFEIDETFSERFSDWEVSGDPSCCEVPDPDGDKIGQVRVSPAIPFYDEKFRTRYDLAAYYNPNSPAFFFGCYTADDLKAIQKHQSLAVVIWAGTDALNMRKALESVGKHPFGPNVRHVAISEFIENDLKALGLPFVSLPLCNVDEKLFQPTPRSGKRGIYAYVPKHDPEKYGASFIEEVRQLTPEFDWIINDGLNYTPDEMAAIYAQCFCGLRAVKHDGLSNTRVEMGLMGRHVFMPFEREPFWSPETTCQLIRDFAASEDDYLDISEHWRQGINVGSEWKTTAFYEQKPMQTMTPELALEPYDYEKYFEFRYSQGELGAGGPDPDGAEAEYTRKTILELLDKYGCNSVVEFGCGSMARWDKLPRNAYRGFDISETALAHARRKFPHGIFTKYDITSDDEPGFSWSGAAVVCIDMMQHIRPEDFDRVLNKMLAQATKVLIIKTSVNIPELYYQFNHQWAGRAVQVDSPPRFKAMEVPGVPCSRIFVFDKSVCASGGAGGFNVAVAAPPPSLSLEDVLA